MPGVRFYTHMQFCDRPECNGSALQAQLLRLLFPDLIVVDNFITFDYLKMPGPIFQNGNFYSNDASSPKISWCQISFKSVKPVGHKKRLHILQLPIPYCVSLIMVTITSHIFTDIFRTVHFSAVKFTRGNGKNMSFLLIPKSPKV